MSLFLSFVPGLDSVQASILR